MLQANIIFKYFRITLIKSSDVMKMFIWMFLRIVDFQTNSLWPAFMREICGCMATKGAPLSAVLKTAFNRQLNLHSLQSIGLDKGADWFSETRYPGNGSSQAWRHFSYCAPWWLQISFYYLRLAAPWLFYQCSSDAADNLALCDDDPVIDAAVTFQVFLFMDWCKCKI